MLVCAAGIPKMKVSAKSGLSFTDLNEMLANSERLGQLFSLVKWSKKTKLAASDVFTMKDGIYIVHSYYYHSDDIDFKYAEAIDHYIVYNAGTRVLFLYPEVR